MASSLKNLSVFEKPVPSAADYTFGIVVSEWNSEITNRLAQGAIDLLLKQGASEGNIVVESVPGTFELSLGAQYMSMCVDAVIALGCVIQGETRHFDFICSAVAHGITDVQLSTEIPVAFGVLTVDNMDQALDRAGGKHGNKGEEAAATAIKMLHFQAQVEDHTVEMIGEDLFDDFDIED